MVLSLASSRSLSRMARVGALGVALLLANGRVLADNSATVAELTAQADRWDKAIVRKDRVAVEANMADDFRNIDGYGQVAGKAAFVADLMSADLEIDPYTVEDFDVRVYGDVALLSGRTHMTGRYNGKPFTSHYRYIDVYVKRGGRWKVVSVQISRIPPEASKN